MPENVCCTQEFRLIKPPRCRASTLPVIIAMAGTNRPVIVTTNTLVTATVSRTKGNDRRAENTQDQEWPVPASLGHPEPGGQSKRGRQGEGTHHGTHRRSAANLWD